MPRRRIAAGRPRLEDDAFGLSSADLGRYVPGWWRKLTPADGSACFARKTDALKLFYDHNLQVIEPWGIDRTASGGEFDSINVKYDLRGKKRVKTLAKALWEAMPAGAPYCIDKIDLEALNDTTPAKEAGGFRLPDVAVERQLVEQEERYYQEQEPVSACGEGCRTVTWRRKKRGDEMLAESEWRRACRCNGRKLRTGKRCRLGGDDFRERIQENLRDGLRGMEALEPARFVKCEPEFTLFGRARGRGRRRPRRR